MIHTLHRIFPNLHDTEIWASYLPRLPEKLYWPAALGIGVVAVSARGVQNSALGWAGIAVGALLILPAFLTGLFVLWRWNYRSHIREQMLDAFTWQGDEHVLDVGCGNGILLNGAAKRLKNGKAIGIDIWAPSGGGGNLALLWKNARAEGVADRIEFKEADARQMPFAEASFDVVVCSGALHHIVHNFAEHDQTMREMARVLKPGGHLVISDVQHMVEASTVKLQTLGLICEQKKVPPFFEIEMGLMVGVKAR